MSKSPRTIMSIAQQHFRRKSYLLSPSPNNESHRRTLSGKGNSCVRRRVIHLKA